MRPVSADCPIPLTAPPADGIVVVRCDGVGMQADAWLRSRSINEGLAWLKTLKKRHEELLALRNDNAHRERRFYGASADKEIVKEPVYDVKVLDRLVTRVAHEIRLLEQALKATNARTTVDAYDQDDAVLGELT